MWADSLWWHFGKEGCQICGVGETLLGVFESQPSPFYAQDTKHPASALPRPWRVVS
jgi:hypothetical protein